MTSYLFDAYVKAYEVALYGQGTACGRHRGQGLGKDAAVGTGGLRRSAGRALRGLLRTSHP